MADILSIAETLLESAGFTTVAPDPAVAAVCFEDATLLGTLYVLPSVSDLVNRWEELQDAFLRSNASKLVLDPLKAWNSYTVLLTQEPATRPMIIDFAAIEEDFRGTRKIARAGLTSKGAIESALAPLLPLRRLQTLAPDDARARLAGRLSDLGLPHHDLLSGADTRAIAASVLGSE